MLGGHNVAGIQNCNTRQEVIPVSDKNEFDYSKSVRSNSTR